MAQQSPLAQQVRPQQVLQQQQQLQAVQPRPQVQQTPQQAQLLQFQQLQQKQLQAQAQLSQQGVAAQAAAAQAQALAAQKQFQGQLMIQRPPGSQMSPQLQLVRAPSGQIIVQQNPAQLIGMQNPQQGSLVRASIANQAVGVRTVGAVVQGPAAGMQQRMAFAANMVQNGMQIRPGFPGQPTVAAVASQQQQQQQQQMSRKLYEAQLLRQQEQLKLQQQQEMLQQDPNLKKQIYKIGESSHKAVRIFLLNFYNTTVNITSRLICSEVK